MMPFSDCGDCFVSYRCPVFAGRTPRPDKVNCPYLFRIEQALAMADVPAKYAKKMFKDFQLDNDNRNYWEALKTVISSLSPDAPDFFNLIITGSANGTGKTLGGITLLNEWIVKKYGMFDWDRPLAMYADFSSLMKRIKDSIDNPDEELHSYIKDLKTCPLLVIDDVGATRLTPYVRDEAFVIFNERYMNDRSTVIISNYPVDFLRQDDSLTNRVIDRLTERGLIIAVKGQSRRRSV